MVGFWGALCFLDSPWSVFFVNVLVLFLVFFNVLYLGTLPVWFVWVAFVLLVVCFAFFGFLMRWEDS